jgi:hypothetical protein
MPEYENVTFQYLAGTIILDSAYNKYYDNLRSKIDMPTSQNDTENRFWGSLTNG